MNTQTTTEDLDFEDADDRLSWAFEPAEDLDYEEDNGYRAW